MKDKVHNGLNDEVILKSSDSSSFRRQEFSNYLDAEINNLQKDIQRPGWTNWAFLVSIATLSWLLLNYIELGGYSLTNVMGLLLIISLLINLCLVISALSSVLSPDEQNKVRFLDINSIMKNRIAAILITGQYSLLIFWTLRLSEFVGIITTTISCIYLTLFLLTSILICILMFFNFPIPIPQPRKLNNIISNSLSFFLLLFIIWRYIEHFFIPSSTVHISDFRVAFLITAIFYLVLLLVHNPRGKLILDSLITIRRQFFSGEISLGTASIQTDIALSGFRAHNILEGYVSKILYFYREASTELQKSSKYLDDIEVLYCDNQSQQEEQPSLARPLLESLAKSTIKTRGIIAEHIPKALEPLQKRVYWISSQVTISDTIDEFNQKLDTAKEDFRRNLDTMEEKLKRIMATYNVEQE